MNSHQEEVGFWEQLFEDSEGPDHRKQIWDHAKAIGQIDNARVGFMRTTYPKGERP